MTKTLLRCALYFVGTVLALLYTGAAVYYAWRTF